VPIYLPSNVQTPKDERKAEMTSEQIKYNLEEDIETGLGMYREVDVTDLKHALRLIREYENTIDNLQGRIDALNETNRILIESQDKYAKSRIIEFAIQLQKYYNSVPGSTHPKLVTFHVSTKMQEFLDEMFKEDHNGD
jgi:hypothetical protein